MTNKIHGVFVPMITPFKKEDESIDEKALRSHTNFLINNGVNGLIPCGSTGEFISMDLDERKKVVEIVVDEAKGRALVYASTGHYSTKLTIELSKHAEKAGADGIMVITPYYLPRNEIELYQHYKELRKAVSIPIMLYHNPHFSAVKLTDGFMAKCYNDGLINSVKEGEGDVHRLSDLRYLTNDDFAIFYGFDACVVESLAMVADGWVAGTGNLIPAEASKVYKLVKEGKLEDARKLWFKIKPFIDLCTTPTDEGLPAPWLAILKEGLALRGEQGGVPRKPAMALQASVKDKLAKVLKDLGH